MLCETASWIPAAVSSTLHDQRSREPIIAWLTNIRGATEEYDTLVTVRPPSPESEDDSSTTSPDSAFDEILSQLGNEIYRLDLYQRKIKGYSEPEEDLSLSILDIFDKCLEGMSDGETELVNGDSKECNEQDNELISDNNVIVPNEVLLVNGAVNGEESECESTLSDVSFVTSAPAVEVNDISNMIESEGPPPVPPRRTRVRTPSPSSSSSVYDSIEPKIEDLVIPPRRLSTDSESTCWSYKECSIDCDDEHDHEESEYSVLWSHSSGYHNSNKILMRVLSQHQATISTIVFDTASEFSPTKHSVYSFEVGDRCDNDAPVAAMTPDRPTDDGYEPVRDAITTDDHVYEDIDFAFNYTDEGCSCEGSVEVESCSISVSSEGVGRESPLYANLRDNDAYAVPASVLSWKKLLSNPFYNEDEEDEWITPEEYTVYSREQRPPLVIPRIREFRPQQRRNTPLAYQEEPSKYEKLQEWSPTSERSKGDIESSYSNNSDSSYGKLIRRFDGSMENLLLSNVRRPNHLQLQPQAYSSGDSLDVEIRENKDHYARTRKAKSMVANKNKMQSPIPTPRSFPQVLMEGPVKRSKYLEGGKKCRKHWTECYMILIPTALYFYKDHKAYLATRRPPGTPPNSNSGSELVLPLKNALIAKCIPNHTKRHLRSLILTVEFDQYLIQSETEELSSRWEKRIKDAFYDLGRPRDDPPPQYNAIQSSNTDLDSIGRTPPSRHSDRSNQKAGGSSNEDLSDSTEVSLPKSYVKRKLRNFFLIRPSMDSLVKKGIYQEEPVFGRRLEEVCPPTSPRVPTFVRDCVQEIEQCEDNMKTDGLYRASGNLSQVQKIRLEVDQNNLSVIENCSDIHVLTGSLKLFFRELKEPLIPCNLFDRILAACSIKPREAKIKEFRSIVNALPQCNRDTLKFLLEHLLRVTKYSESNRMHTANLAIVFGPTLLWAPEEQAHNIAIDCIQQNHVVEILLNEFKDIFADDGKGKKKT